MSDLRPVLISLCHRLQAIAAKVIGSRHRLIGGASDPLQASAGETHLLLQHLLGALVQDEEKSRNTVHDGSFYQLCDFDFVQD